MRYEWQCRRSFLPVKAMAHSMEQKPPKLAKIDHKTEIQVSFKVTLLRNDSKFAKPGDLCLFDKIEVRRFVIPKERSTSLVYLKERIRSIEVQPRDAECTKEGVNSNVWLFKLKAVSAMN